MALSLSLYIHIPFCESLCYYCACNKVITKRHDRATSYLRYLTREVEMHIEHLGVGKNVSQLHLGGGTPTYMSDDELRGLMVMLHSNFSMAPDGEYSLDVDPRTTDASRLNLLAELGFKHLRFGIQDFDPVVQKAVHRVQPAEQVIALVDAARQRGFVSISVDLLYGLPRQSTETFDRTIAQVIELRPERIALCAYAHLPERFKPQRRIAATYLPDRNVKGAMRLRSVSALLNAGYVHVGLDHFALHTDALAIAKRQGRLYRNLQGYSTQPDCDVIGLGMSSIGRIGATYSQNAKTLDEYYDALNQGRFPVVRGLALSRDDLVRRAVIMAMLTQGEILYESINLAHLIEFQTYFASEIEALQKLADQGLVTVDKNGIQITATGWFFVRTVAKVFDRYLQTDLNRAMFSKII